MKKTLFTLIIVLLFGTLYSTSLCWSEDKEDTAALKEEIRQLKERISQLEKNQAQPSTAAVPNASANQWDPFEEMRQMQNEMENMFQNSFYRRGPSSSGVFNNVMSFDSQFNVEDKGNNYLVEIDTTGFDKDKLNVEVHNNSITVSGVKKSETKEDNAQGSFQSQSYGSFLKTVPLPLDADTNSVKMDKQENKIIVNIPKKQK